MVYLDTESVGSTGPLVLIQWGEQTGEHLHYVWDKTINNTLELIKWTASEEVIGFNLTHDWFQLTKWYNVFRRVKDYTKPPDVKEIKILEAEGPQPDDVCLKPRAALDLMIFARSHKFQYLAKHKPVVIKKVPTVLYEEVIEALYQIPFPEGVKIRWRPSEKKTGRTDVIDILGEFTNQSTSLKTLASIILGKPEIAQQKFEVEVGRIPYQDEPDWRPWGGDWERGLAYLQLVFRTSERAKIYASNDIIYTRELHNFLGYPPAGDDDSELACLIGASHWRGFSVNLELIDKLLIKYHEEEKIAPTAPRAVLDYLRDGLSDIEKLVITNTKKTTLEELARWDSPVAEKVKQVQTARRAQRRKDILRKLKKAKAFIFSMKVQGTLSNRMAGGSELSDGMGRGGKTKLNPQGIPRETEFRQIFNLAWPGESVEGGDFDALEVTIADAVYNDTQLHADILSPIKIHALNGSIFFDTTPQEILESKGTLDDNYLRSKNAFFGGVFYGAMLPKVAKTLNLLESVAGPRLEKVKQKYPKILEHRQKLAERFTPIWQPDGPGTEVVWNEPDEFIESIFGFRRYFTLEWAIVKGLYVLADHLPTSIKERKGTIRRTNREQTFEGAVRSALYAAIFSLQSHVFRAAANHEIQSPGAQLTKSLQRTIWDLQPVGINPWQVRPFNVHDEVLTCLNSITTVPEVVKKWLKKWQEKIPSLSMKWNPLLTWGDK